MRCILENIIINKELVLNTTNKAIITFITDTLRIINPDYVKRLRLNLWVGKTPKTLNLYTVNGNTYTLPFGVKGLLERFLIDSEISYQFTYEHGKKPIIMLPKGNVELYDYQVEEQVLKHTNGILVSPAGSGKTRMAMDLIGS